MTSLSEQELVDGDTTEVDLGCIKFIIYENVGIIVFNNDTAIEGVLVKRIGSIADVPGGKAMLGRGVNALRVLIDGSDHKQ